MGKVRHGPKGADDGGAMAAVRSAGMDMGPRKRGGGRWGA
jgi:hypothetical protein